MELSVSQSSNPLKLAISAAIAAGSMFSMQAMAHGYMQGATTATKVSNAKGAANSVEATDTLQQKAHAQMKGTKADREGSCGMAKMDTDKDGRLSRAEFEAAHKGSKETFASLDLDGDGFITQAEMDAHQASMKKHGDKAMDDAAMKKMQAEGKCGEGKCGGSA
jgi:uncharacterized low-complexity protein